MESSQRIDKGKYVVDGNGKFVSGDDWAYAKDYLGYEETCLNCENWNSPFISAEKLGDRTHCRHGHKLKR